ncbi:MAG: hypothetical protein Q7R79_05625 [bacterium]|nr:hypothetical protein [bacterium]
MFGVKLSNGHTLDYVTSSGALGYDGGGWPHEQLLRLLGLLDPSLFTNITKTFTFKPHEGELRWYNPLRCVRIYSNGAINAVKLTNPGIQWFCKNVGPFADRSVNALVVSITAENTPYLARMARLLEECDIAAIQLNPHCPNLEGTSRHRLRNLYAAVEAVKRNTRHPLLLTLSPSIAEESIMRLDGMVEAITINSVPFEMTDKKQKSPLAHLGGGSVSGKRAHPFTWNYALRLMERSAIPIGFPVWETADLETIPRLIERFVRDADEKAYFYTFGSVFIPYPWRPTFMVRNDMRWRREHASK